MVVYLLALLMLLKKRKVLLRWHAFRKQLRCMSGTLSELPLNSASNEKPKAGAGMFHNILRLTAGSSLHPACTPLPERGGQDTADVQDEQHLWGALPGDGRHQAPRHQAYTVPARPAPPHGRPLRLCRRSPPLAARLALFGPAFKAGSRSLPSAPAAPFPPLGTL